MKIINFNKYISMSIVAAGLMAFTTSCKDDEEEMEPVEMKSETYSYEFNNGQVAASAAYDSTHKDDLYADLKVETTEDGLSKVTVTLYNSMDGETYMVHAHDKMDPNETPNGTPYNETPNSDVLVQSVDGNGGEVSVSQKTNMSYADITSSYEGFFVVHDPLQPVNTADISSYLVVGSFARAQSETGFERSTFSYDFNTGQTASQFAYSGSHAADLTADVTVQELAAGNSRVSVDVQNTMSGEMYAIHSHDKADPNNTPNGTPYNETPNADVMVRMKTASGSSISVSQLSPMSHSDLTTTYEAFFVIHDPLQPINTADPTTYLVLNDFAR